MLPIRLVPYRKPSLRGFEIYVISLALARKIRPILSQEFGCATIGSDAVSLHAKFKAG